MAKLSKEQIIKEYHVGGFGKYEMLELVDAKERVKREYQKFKQNIADSEKRKQRDKLHHIQLALEAEIERKKRIVENKPRPRGRPRKNPLPDNDI